MESCRELDISKVNDVWRSTEEDYPMFQKLENTIDELKNARTEEQEDMSHLKYLLMGCAKRNHLGIDSKILHYTCFGGTKDVVEEYRREVGRAIDFVTEKTINHHHTSSTKSTQNPSHNNHHQTMYHSQKRMYQESLSFMNKLGRSLGHTALCLSGGGSLAMFHMGVIRTLIQEEGDLYSKIKVVSGTSGGSIVAAMCACKTVEELLSDVTCEDVSTDFKRNGSQKELDIRWFPPLMKEIIYFAANGCLMDNKEFQRCCEFYYEDITFEEGYQRTKKHVCIGVSASRWSEKHVNQKLLLNHISTPHVLIRSAVASSCALPGIMEPNPLLVKNMRGEIVPFEIDGVEWIDGSIGADLPMQRIASLFSVTNFLVAQVNPHVVPFMSHRIDQPGVARKSGESAFGSGLLHFLAKTIDMDLRNRVQSLSKVGVMPRFYGQVFKQRYHGDVTIIPEMRISDSLGLKAILNPTVEDMRVYISEGAKATWIHIDLISHMLSMESAIWKAVEKLKSSYQKWNSDLQKEIFNPSSSSPTLSSGGDWKHHPAALTREPSTSTLLLYGKEFNPMLDLDFDDEGDDFFGIHGEFEEEFKVQNNILESYSLNQHQKQIQNNDQTQTTNSTSFSASSSGKSLPLLRHTLKAIQEYKFMLEKSKARDVVRRERKRSLSAESRTLNETPLSQSSSRPSILQNLKLVHPQPTKNNNKKEEEESSTYLSSIDGIDFEGMTRDEMKRSLRELVIYALELERIEYSQYFEDEITQNEEEKEEEEVQVSGEIAILGQESPYLLVEGDDKMKQEIEN